MAQSDWTTISTTANNYFTSISILSKRKDSNLRENELLLKVLVMIVKNILLRLSYSVKS